MTRLTEQLDLDAQTIIRLLAALPSVDDRIRQMLPGDIGAQSYDSGGRGTIVWCDAHERTVDECHRAELWCDGVPLPNVTDPTGDAAVADRVLEDVRKFKKAARQVHHWVEEMAKVISRFQMIDDPTPDRDADLEHANRPKCEPHRRYGHDRNARSTTRVKVDGDYVLSQPYPLCEWCFDTVSKLRRLPTAQEIERNVQGKRLRVPA